MDFVDETWLPGGKLSQVSICRHSRKRLGVSLHFERLGGRSCGCCSIDSINSIQSGCNYQYATATHLSITSLLTHSTRCFCAFSRQLPQIEIYSASSRTVDSQFTGLHPPFLPGRLTICVAASINLGRWKFSKIGRLKGGANLIAALWCHLKASLKGRFLAP